MNLSWRLQTVSLVVLLAIFTFFTWRGMTMFYSGDDMMNMFGAWKLNPWVLARAQLFLWIPVARPLGNAVYRIFYGAFGFHPAPLYLFCWLLLVLNLGAAYALFKTISSDATVALIALSLVLVHGSYTDLYYSAGTIYDRLCFLFVAATIVVYVKWHPRSEWRRSAVVCLLAVLAMDSKETGVTVPALLLVCECLFFRPARLTVESAGIWFRARAPFFATLSLLALVFVLGRVNRTPEMVQTSAYHAEVGLHLWLTHVAEYLNILTYHRTAFGVAGTAVFVIFFFGAAFLARSRAMMFGLLFFVITITPVALIEIRPGYVLYLPAFGLGLCVAAVISRIIMPLRSVLPHATIASFLLITASVTYAHARNWPRAPDPKASPEWRLTQQFLRDYPQLPPKSNLLFVSDDFPPAAWDLMFNVELLYHDRSMVVHRLDGMPDQGPNPKYHFVYSHIFALESGRYVELDPSKPAEAIRLNILRNVPVANEMDMGRPDHSAYVVSGVMDIATKDAYRWTGPDARFKFRLGSIPRVFTARLFTPAFLAESKSRTVTFFVNGTELGKLALNESGLHDVTFPLPDNLVQTGDYTFVDLRIQNPFRDPKGVNYGIVVVRAGFEF